jgi:hypothetical protein
VIAAYNGRCALSGLPAPVLLDAAHIVADNDERLGQPVVPNATQPVAFVLIPHDYATCGKNVGKYNDPYILAASGCSDPPASYAALACSP